MENQITHTKKPPELDEDEQVTGSHISLSPSPERDTVSHSIPPPSISPPRENSSPTLSPLRVFKVPIPDPPRSDHISLSPQLGNSPSRSSLSTLSRGSSPENEISNCNSPQKHQNVAPLPLVVNVPVPEEPVDVVTKKDTGGGGKSTKPSLSIFKRTQRERMVKKAALGFRVLGFLFCLVSFAVMAADRNQGWALDSFQRYKEFMYCMSVNAIGFIYSGAQALDLSYNIATGKYFQQRFRQYFDFAIDQVISYLLISASSSAATRIDDWQSNWGKDKFPEMATGSVSMSFLAFVVVAFSSLISGYALFTSKVV